MLLDAATAMVEPSPSAESAVVEAVVDAAGLALDQLRGAADALHMTRALSPIVYEVIDSLAAALAAYNDARGGRGT